MTEQRGPDFWASRQDLLAPLKAAAEATRSAKAADKEMRAAIIAAAQAGASPQTISDFIKVSRGRVYQIINEEILDYVNPRNGATPGS